MTVAHAASQDDIAAEMARIGTAARQAAGRLAIIETAGKDAALTAAAAAIRDRRARILAANAEDMALARERGTNALAATKKPGVQIPHCSAAYSRKRCWSGCSRSPWAMPSMVSTDRPCASAPSTRQEQTSRPSSMTLHAPQSPEPQPSLLPVK